MRVIFLDFDGVLNTYGFFSAGGYQDRGDPSLGLDPRAIEVLNEIVARTDASVVLSTTWRHNHPFQDLVAFLKRRGFAGKVIGITPTLDGMARGHEVEDWLRSNPDVEAFVCLDDLNEFPMMRDRHIRTDPTIGLVDEHVERAVAILATPVPMDEASLDDDDADDLLGELMDGSERE